MNADDYEALHNLADELRDTADELERIDRETAAMCTPQFLERKRREIEARVRNRLYPHPES